MTRIFVGLVAAAVIGAAAFFLWTTWGDAGLEDLTGAGIEQAAEPARSARRTAEEPSGTPVDSAVAPGLGGDPATSLHGRVVDGQGRAVADARVSLHVGLRRDESPEVTIEGPRTDADGRFRLEGVPHGVVLRLVARHPELQDATAAARLRQGEDRDLGEITAAAGGAVSGRVVTGDGAPVSGAALRVHPAGGEGDSPFALLRVISRSIERGRTGTSDEHGQFRISGVAPGKVRLVAEAAGYPPAVHDAVEIAAGRETTGVVVRMRPGHDLEVAVRSRQGTPLRGAKVRLRSSGFEMDDLLTQIHGALRGETDGEGRLVLRGLGPRAYQLEVVQPGYFGETVPIQSDQTRVEVELRPVGLVWGVVTAHHDGTPIDDFTADVSGGEHLQILRGQEAAAAASTDEVPGLFAVTGNTEDHLTLVVKADGYAHARRTLRALGSEPVREDVALVLQVPFAGRVVDSGGDPVAGAQVRVSAPVASRGGASTPDLRALEAMSGSRRASRRAVSGADGTFRIDGLMPGEVTVSASADRHLDAEPEVLTLVAGRPVDGHEIVLPRGGTLRGIVRDVAGSPLKGAVVRLDRQKEEGTEEKSVRMRLIGGSLVGGGFKDAVSDADGRYEIFAIPPGDYRVKVDEPSKQQGDAALRVVGLAATGAETGEPVTFSGDEVVTLDLAIQPKARVVGTVTAASDPVGGVRIDARLADAALVLGNEPGALTAADGTYVIDEVKPGTYRVSARAPGSPSTEVLEVEVLPGADAVVDFALPGGVIRGRVIDAATGDGVAGAEIRARSKEEESDAEDALHAVQIALDTGGGMRRFGGRPAKPVVTDAGGSYELPYVQPGTYSVVCRHAGFIAPDAVEAVVADGEVTDGVDFSLFRGGTLEVRVENAPTGAGPFAFLRFTLARDGEKPTRRSSIESEVRFEGLEPGTYTVTVEGAGARAEGTAVVQAGYVETLVLRMQ